MAISIIGAALAAAGVLSALSQSQRYYDEGTEPSRGQIYGNAIGAGLSGYLGGSTLGSLGGGGGGAQGIGAADIAAPALASGTPQYIPAAQLAGGGFGAYGNQLRGGAAGAGVLGGLGGGNDIAQQMLLANMLGGQGGGGAGYY